MKRKPRITTLFIILLMVVGLGVMLFPKFNDMYSRWKASQEIAQYNQVAEAQAEDYSEMWAAAEEYNQKLAAKAINPSAYATQEETEEVSQLLNPLGNGMMGYIDVPKINVHLPIYQGTEERALQAGAGFWLGTSLPTGGESTHCVLTAHNGLVKAKMFTDLDKLEIGDTFSLTILDRVLTYEIDQILVTEPDDFEPLRIVEGEDYVTLYTCTPYGINTHRLLVRGTRIPTPEDAQEVGVIQAITGGLGWEMVLVIVLLLLILALLIWLIRYLLHRKKRIPGTKETPIKEEEEKSNEKREE